MTRVARPLALARIGAILTFLVAMAVSASAQSVSLLVPPAGAAREAWQALEDARYKDAETAFDRALAANPDDATLLLGSAIVARRLNQASKAKDAFTRALQIDPALTRMKPMDHTDPSWSGRATCAYAVYPASPITNTIAARDALLLVMWTCLSLKRV